MKVAVLLLCGLVLAAANTSWEEFKAEYDKKYKSTEEESYRKKVFEENLQHIEDNNKKYERGEISFTMKINKLGDLTEDEVSAMMNGRRGTQRGALRPRDE
nr:digestive cysteine proteinase 2-like isoform X2 [Procambarus clarkii]XP_045616606.1 digestive cysteine proteinase 2-like isoform X2 [Procambarus clarkii]